MEVTLPPSTDDAATPLSIPPFDRDYLTADLPFYGDIDVEDFPPFDGDFTFTFDDLSFADDLLLEPIDSDLSHDLTPNPNPNFDCSSQESNFREKSNCSSPNSGVSLESGNLSDRDVSSDIQNPKNDALDGKIKVEGSKINSKRKKEVEMSEISGDDIDRVSKLKRSSMANDSVSINISNGDDDEKKKARLMRNRESAQLSRQRKKHYVEELEDKVRAMHSTITDLNTKVSYVMAENAALRQQIGGQAGVCPAPPPPGMFPMGVVPMPYPWMPCPPYMVKPQGSQVPLVPIPRLKPQKPEEGAKERKKSSKKVASVSLLGFVFCLLLFGGLLPMVNVRYGGGGEGFGGAVLMVDSNVDRVGGFKGHGRVLHQSNNVSSSNCSSGPLTASLYVPRNDKMVKIDGNLIIHSVLASEKAVASNNNGSGMKGSEETSLAIAGVYPPYPINGRHPQLDGNSKGRQRALGPGASEKSKPEGQLQQWFREGLAGPMLSSGMCTEVFQFDVSPTPGSIVPATSISNTTSEHHQNSSRPNIPRNRRILEQPIPLHHHPLNLTEEHVHPHEENDGLHSNKTHPSMVVSVLVDPREAGDGDGEGVIRSKTLTRIFVVVLIDSVKYVTYSCMLPFVGSGNHLVTS